MSGHVAPHRWADAWAGRVAEAERAAMDRHADACAACDRARARVQGASDSFGAIRALSAPELPWDSVRARVHWSVSSERRARVRARSAGAAAVWGPRAAIAGLACGALALAVGTGPARIGGAPRAATAGGQGGQGGHGAPGAQVPAAASADELPPARPLIGLVTRVGGGAPGDVGGGAGEVMIALAGAGDRADADAFAQQLGPGARIATGRGRVDVQFGGGTALALGPRSRVDLVAFDSRSVELAVDGTIDLEVAPRMPHQRLIVRAGALRIEVRGTQFRVRHSADATEVSCRRGMVAVTDGGGGPPLEVAGGQRVVLPPGARASEGRVVALSPEQAAALAESTPIAMSAWDPAALLAGSAPLEIAAAGRREVRLDGIEIGAAPVQVRVMAGRHTIEAADRAGRFRRVGWVDVAPPVAGAARARFTLPSDPAPTPGVMARRRQLQAGLDRARLAQCMRRVAKQGLTGTYVQIEIAVDAGGAVSYLNVVDTDLGAATASCVRDVLRDARFGAGAAASWRERIEL